MLPVTFSGVFNGEGVFGDAPPPSALFWLQNFMEIMQIFLFFCWQKAQNMLQLLGDFVPQGPDSLREFRFRIPLGDFRPPKPYPMTCPSLPKF